MSEVSPLDFDSPLITGPTPRKSTSHYSLSCGVWVETPLGFRVLIHPVGGGVDVKSP